MVRWIHRKRRGPIGVDLGNRSVKLIQFDHPREKILELARWELPREQDESEEVRDRQVSDAIRQAISTRNFQGCEAVLCLGAESLFVQNIRVPKVPSAELQRVVHAEAEARLPFDLAESEIRFLDAGDVRQGDMVKREVIVLACRKQQLERLVKIAEDGGLRPQAIDTQPSAMLRSAEAYFRRDSDKTTRRMLVHVGASNTVVVIAQGSDPLFVKYLDICGNMLDATVARHLKMDLDEAISLRRNNGDRRADQQDPDIARSVKEATRSVVDRLAQELSLCTRYHSVTFRGHVLKELTLSGGEASESLMHGLAERLHMECELAHPLRAYPTQVPTDRDSQWDIAMGLALRDLN
jgi:type IV pilus assembly protein PilM